MSYYYYRSIDWENLDADNSSRYFLNLVTDSFLTQQVSSPTRGSDILDFVFTTDAWNGGRSTGMRKSFKLRSQYINMGS